MTLSKPELENVCRLAKLKSPEVDLDKLHQDINAIMTFVEQLKTGDAGTAEPLFHPFELHQKNREDLVSEESCLEELQSIAPLFDEGHYLVPKVIEE